MAIQHPPLCLANRSHRSTMSTPSFRKYNSPPTNCYLTDLGPASLTTLPSGLRVVTESNSCSKHATLGVHIDYAGSRYESYKTFGTSNLLAHSLFFMGTEIRTPRQLEQEMQSLGGLFKLDVSREMTSYFARVMDTDVYHTIHIFSDILQNSNFKKKKIEREKRLYMDLIEEQCKELCQERKNSTILDRLHATAFLDSPLGRTQLQLVENVKSITNKDLRKYISTHYTASRMVISASGAAEHEEIVGLVRLCFTNLSQGSTTTSDVATKDTTFFTPSEFRIIDNALPLAHFAVGFLGASLKDRDSTALIVIRIMLNSILEQKLRITEVGKYTRGFNYSYRDIGMFGVHAAVEPDCLADIAYSIMYEVRQLCYQVSEDDVAHARNLLKSDLLHMDETDVEIQELWADIGFQLLMYGRRIPQAELLAKVDSVDASTVKRVARRFILNKDFAIAAVGSVRGVPSYNWFRDRLQE